MNWDWEPCRRVGVFEFGADLSNYRDEYELELVPEEYSESVGWEVYRPQKDDVRVYVENNSIVQIGCFESLLLEGLELIGLPIQKVKQILGMEPDENDILEVMDELEQVYEFEQVEAQFWTKDDRVVAIFCGRTEEEALAE
jgi:hypothetical protein